MAVELDRFSVTKAPVQAIRLQKLWENPESPATEGISQRYRDYPHALKNVLRLAWASSYESYIVYKTEEERRNRVAIGTASIIFGAGLARVGDGKIYSGNDLDYRFASEQDNYTHTATARELVYESSRRELGRTGAPIATGPSRGDMSVNKTVNRVIVTTPVGADYNRGLHTFTSAVGEETRYLDLPSATIPEIAPDGSTVLYTGEFEVEKPMFRPMTVKRVA